MFSLISKAKALFKPKETPLQTFIKGLQIEYDQQNNCYHVSLPNNVVFYSGGVIILKNEGDMILSSPNLHLNPPVTMLNDRRIKNGN